MKNQQKLSELHRGRKLRSSLLHNHSKQWRRKMNVNKKSNFTITYYQDDDYRQVEVNGPTLQFIVALLEAGNAGYTVFGPGEFGIPVHHLYFSLKTLQKLDIQFDGIANICGNYTLLTPVSLSTTCIDSTICID